MKEAPTFAFYGAKDIGNGPVPSLERDKQQKFRGRAPTSNKRFGTKTALETVADLR
jgi:hypothetical protein